MIKIRRWSFIKTGGGATSFSIPSKVESSCLQGTVYNHPRFSDGEIIVTSPLLKVNLMDRVVKTTNTLYKLEGGPDPEWFKWFKVVGGLEFTPI